MVIQFERIYTSFVIAVRSHLIMFLLVWKLLVVYLEIRVLNISKRTSGYRHAFLFGLASLVSDGCKHLFPVDVC